MPSEEIINQGYKDMCEVFNYCFKKMDSMLKDDPCCTYCGSFMHGKIKHNDGCKKLKDLTESEVELVCENMGIDFEPDIIKLRGKMVEYMEEMKKGLEDAKRRNNK